MGVSRVLLAGGGHSHVEVLRRFARQAPACELTLVSPDASTAYSGMLPGLIAGHYTQGQSHIDLAPLVGAARGRFIIDRIVALDPAARTATLAGGATASFDLLSLDVGSTPRADIDGAGEHAVGVKPVARFLAAWQETLDDVAAGRVRAIAMVGGGIGGIETLLAMQYRLRHVAGKSGPAFHLISQQSPLQHALARRLLRVLDSRGVALHVGRAAVAVRDRAVVLDDQTTIAADRVFLATGASPAPWLAASGLTCDVEGFVRVDDRLRSVSHPCVFAAGDCASQGGRSHPRSGVYAVRQGPVLAANIAGVIAGHPLRRYVPQARALALVATGGQHAIAAYGPIAFAGDWVWRWKDRIDRRFVARYRLAKPD